MKPLQLTVDGLRKLDGYAHYMGLGVVKYVFRNNRSYHFYSELAPILVEDIHEHRFGFTSKVIKGELKNYIYDIDGQDPDSTLQVERGECSPGAERTIEVPNANVVEMCTFTTVAGQSYHIAYDTLHRVECVTPKVITLLDKELPFQQENPRFITDAANPSPCAFSQPKSEKECWEIIEYTLNDDK